MSCGERSVVGVYLYVFFFLVWADSVLEKEETTNVVIGSERHYEVVHECNLASVKLAD